MKEYKQLTVNGKSIGRNHYGAFNANHLHAASGYVGKMPQYWLKNGFAIREIELIKHFGLSQPVYIEPGENGFDEVYLSREFTLVYAESIGKKFYYQVVKAFDNMMLENAGPGYRHLVIGGRFTAANPAFYEDKNESMDFDDKELAINLNHAIDECRKTGIKLPSRKDILNALRNDHSFVCNKVFNSRLTGKTVRCFLFNR